MMETSSSRQRNILFSNFIVKLNGKSLKKKFFIVVKVEGEVFKVVML